MDEEGEGKGEVVCMQPCMCACLCACPLPAKLMLLTMPRLLKVGRLLSQVHFDVHSGFI